MNDQELRKTLLLIQLDAEALYNRIIFRKDDYLRTMILKRTREHLKQIFRSRYYDIKIRDLRYLNEELIIELEKFYNDTEDLGWYLSHTEDMPATIDEKIGPKIKSIETNYDSMRLLIDTELNLNIEDDEGPPEVRLGELPA